MMVVISVSRRVGQVTLSPSVRTSCRNLNGLILAICFRFRRLHIEVRNPTFKAGIANDPFVGAGSPRKSVAGPQAMGVPIAVRTRRQAEARFAWFFRGLWLGFSVTF